MNRRRKTAAGTDTTEVSLSRVNRWKAAVLVTAAFFITFGRLVLAHDPGLSVLELRVEPARIVAVLSLAAVDARSVAGNDPLKLEAMAAEAIELRFDGLLTSGSISNRAVTDEDGARVELTFDRKCGEMLVVRSGVPARLALGHRQLLIVRTGDGVPSAERMLDASSSEYALDLSHADTGTGSVTRFFTLGVQHIVGGYDHLVFLGALLLGVRRLADVVKTVTAFTVAHSLTLALAVCGLIHAPATIVEPLIALSIVWAGVAGWVHPHADARWKLTFAFGLIHGLGFAGILQELGVGTYEGVLKPLASFNVGVEIGQMGVAAILWPIIRGLNSRPVLSARIKSVCSILIVGAGVYWLGTRISQ